jgi:hypothetical protein
MNLNKLFFTISMVLVSPLLAAESELRGCEIPLSFGWEAGVLPIPLVPEKTVPFSDTVVTVSESALAASSILSAALLSHEAASQAGRAVLALKIVGCQDNSSITTQPLPWDRSPTTLSIGGDVLQYDRGAVIGNWLIFMGMACSHAGLAKYYGSAEVRYPGALVFPALLLLPATTAAAVELIRFGEASEIVLGSASLGAQLLGALKVANLLKPSNFQSRWDPDTEDWVDTAQTEDATKQYGLLFNNYRDGRQWFLVVEIAFSTATGVLAAYQSLQSACLDLLTSVVVIYGGYAATIIILKPSKTPFNRAYITAVATVQFSGALLDVVGTQVDSPTIRQVGSGLMVATQWMITARSLMTSVQRIGRWCLPLITSICSKSKSPADDLEGSIQDVSLQESKRILLENPVDLYSTETEQ